MGPCESYVSPVLLIVRCKDLLILVESRSPSARKLSITVLSAVLGHERMEESSEQCPALAAMLGLARSDGDATVRCAAFDALTGFIGAT